MEISTDAAQNQQMAELCQRLLFGHVKKLIYLHMLNADTGKCKGRAENDTFHSVRNQQNEMSDILTSAKQSTSIKKGNITMSNLNKSVRTDINEKKEVITMTTSAMNNGKYDSIPEEMKDLSRWVGFMKSPDGNGGMSKKPVNVQTRHGASTTDAGTWYSFDMAVQSIGSSCRVGQDAGTISGIGFVFAPPYCGIDIDHCIDTDTGEINPKALEIVEKMNSYTEISPSGTGLHIIYKGNLHPDWRKKAADALGDGVHLEMYQSGRYFTVTGNIFGDTDTVEERDDAAADIQNTYMQATGRSHQRTAPRQAATQPARTNPAQTQAAAPAVRLSYYENIILDKACTCKNGALFSALYHGNWQENYGSHSEADLALCGMLAFWYHRDIDIMDAVFRSSGLMRDKWDRPQSGSTYGAHVLQLAADTCPRVYDPNYYFTH